MEKEGWSDLERNSGGESSQKRVWWEGERERFRTQIIKRSRQRAGPPPLAVYQSALQTGLRVVRGRLKGAGWEKKFQNPASPPFRTRRAPFSYPSQPSPCNVNPIEFPCTVNEQNIRSARYPCGYRTNVVACLIQGTYTHTYTYSCVAKVWLSSYNSPPSEISLYNYFLKYTIVLRPMCNIVSYHYSKTIFTVSIS